MCRAIIREWLGGLCNRCLRVLSVSGATADRAAASGSTGWLDHGG